MTVQRGCWGKAEQSAELSCAWGLCCRRLPAPRREPYPVQRLAGTEGSGFQRAFQGCRFKTRLCRSARLSETSFCGRVLLHGCAQGRGVLGRGGWRDGRILGRVAWQWFLRPSSYPSEAVPCRAALPTAVELLPCRFPRPPREGDPGEKALLPALLEGVCCVAEQRGQSSSPEEEPL